MADVNRGNRPLSPFMFGKYYRFQLTSISSMMVRITGNALIVAAILVVWWLLAAATSPEKFEFIDWLIRSWFGDLVMLGSVWALWYHLGGGLRHLIWDAGVWLDLKRSEMMGWAMFVGATVLTIVTVLVV
ncbi:succinate dehydrogenase, cytochrome b556 subunit [Celeribacter arenosi]|uniref:Succinate dehydrogenase cytochrome b556 subunit n=1 Tax=Celeribacter arenosi TaxID=792649 RepID=A0ABP7K258_9RHOB